MSPHYLARVVTSAGHTIRLIALQFVRPYANSNKNDADDAEAICEVATRLNIRLLPRGPFSRCNCITRIGAGQPRRLPYSACQPDPWPTPEYGLLLPQDIGQLRRGVPGILKDAENQLSSLARGSSAIFAKSSWSWSRRSSLRTGGYISRLSTL